MIKITKEDFQDMESKAIDIFAYPKGNFWVIHSKEDNKFYPIRHKSSQYWAGKPTKCFTEVLHALWSIDSMEWQNPANQKIFN